MGVLSCYAPTENGLSNLLIEANLRSHPFSRQFSFPADANSIEVVKPNRSNFYWQQLSMPERLHSNTSPNFISTFRPHFRIRWRFFLSLSLRNQRKRRFASRNIHECLPADRQECPTRGIFYIAPLKTFW